MGDKSNVGSVKKKRRISAIVEETSAKTERSCEKRGSNARERELERKKGPPAGTGRTSSLSSQPHISSAQKFPCTHKLDDLDLEPHPQFLINRTTRVGTCQPPVPGS